MEHKFTLDIQMIENIDIDALNMVFEYIDANSGYAANKMNESSSSLAYTSYMFECENRFYDVILKFVASSETISDTEVQMTYSVDKVVVKEMGMDEWLDRMNIYRDQEKNNPLYWDMTDE